MLTLALLLALATPDDGLADQIAHCGIALDQISVRHEDVMQDDVATIATPAAALTTPQLSCLAALSMSGRVFAFSDPAAQKRFDPLVEAASRKAAIVEARQWLTDHGLIDRLPIYDPKRQPLAQFSVSLEALCDVMPGTRLRAHGNTMLELLPPANFDMSDVELTRFQCTISASIAADPRGLYTVGFIGNEQFGK